MADEKIREEILTVRELLRSTLESEDPVVGVLAFSQGACLGSALCTDWELGQQIKFGIFICALFPALDLEENSTGKEEKKIEMPCIHVRGSADPYGGQGLKLFQKYFAGENARRVIEFQGRHEVPSKEADVTRTIAEILNIWNSVKNLEGNLADT